MIPTLTVVISAVIACTNLNYQHSPRCTAPVEHFVVRHNGEAFGYLTSGVQFTQVNVVNDLTRLQKFQLEDAYWYVSDKGDIQAESSIEALSIYLSR